MNIQSKLIELIIIRRMNTYEVKYRSGTGEDNSYFVTCKNGVNYSKELKNSINEHVRKVYGPIGKPDFIHFAPNLPKTRSGKIMRRILKKIALGDNNFGDVSTLSDPNVIEELIKTKNLKSRMDNLYFKSILLFKYTNCFTNFRSVFQINNMNTIILSHKFSN